MEERVDAVVIGAGLGGLAAAVTLAGAGRRVLVLEHHTLPGGYAQGFERGPFRFDVSLHAHDALAPGGGNGRVLQELGIGDRVRYELLDPLYVARFPDREVVAHADVFRFEAELCAAFPDDAAGIRGYLDEARAVYHDLRRMSEDRKVGRAAEPAELPARYPHLVQVSGETWEQLLARHVSDSSVRAILGSLWGYLGLSPSMLSALLGAGLLGFYDHGGWYPRGGSQAVSRALESVLRERGGEVRYAQTVSDIRLEQGRAIGVRTAEGLTVGSDVVVSNASAPTTMLELVGRQHLPGEYAERVAAPARSYSNINVYLGLGRDVFAERNLPHELVVFPSYDHDASHNAWVTGDWERAPMMITDYTQVDPGCAPPGCGVVVLSTGASWEYEGVWGTGGDLTDYHQRPRYLELKDRVSDVLVARAEEQVPGLLAAIRHREASTPLTDFAYTRNPSGAIEGYENTVDNTGLGWLPQSTPIANLFLAGAWTNSGGQMPALQSGINAAHLAAAIAAVPAS